MDAVCLFLIVSAASKAFRIVLGWHPQSSDPRQIRLEIDAEKTFIEARWCFVLWGVSTGIMVAGIADVFPDVVPGAMCGTGVLQSMEGFGRRAILFRLVFSGVMFLIIEMERLNRSRPDSPLAAGISRLLLLSSPVFFIGVWDTFRAFHRIDVQAPVSCCAAVYDRFRPLTDAGTASGVPEGYWIIAFGAATILLLASSARVSFVKLGNFRRDAAITAISSMVWVPFAAASLVRVFSAYYYQVLHHHCPWCLFLPEHHFAGFALFGLLTVVALEGPCGYLLLSMIKAAPDLHAAAFRRARKSGLRILFSTTIFLLLVGLPPIIWRLRFGVWMGGMEF
ncbi:MAG: hypothetical protein C4530_11075 [Desulfobacteraceae bacterium]|nr:MAG: hypothetical protein C4530_11075 [Desulfobacteraceae bacterium]